MVSSLAVSTAARRVGQRAETAQEKKTLMDECLAATMVG